MLGINLEDVKKVLIQLAPYLIAIAAVIIVGIIAIVACKNMAAAKKYMVRRQVGLAMVLAIVLVINLICFGPMSTLISLATGNGSIDNETSAAATELVQEIAKEGIVLLQNDEGLLPFDKGSKLNVFGWASTNPCYGGTGSGALNQAYHTTTLLEGLENAGFSLNSDLSDFYTNYRADRPNVGMEDQDWTLPEPPADQYSAELIDGAKAFSDTAVVIITRVGGEGADLPTDMAAVIDGSWNNSSSSYNSGPFVNNSTAYNEFEEGQHYLELSKSERDMLDLVCSNFNNVVVVYNGANAMELGFVDDYTQIKSVLWCPGTGQGGFNSLGTIFNGDTNPSGKTADTFVYDLTATPTWNNFFGFHYDNMDEFPGDNFGLPTLPSFANYVEGIYVGYRYYETAAAEGAIDYERMVQYPFGYGLSYTTFKQEMGAISENNGNISFDVTVTNTGSTAGKDVVEVYYNPPYTNGGIEKASANLAAFAKTKLLGPGESDKINISFKVEDMASYDTYGAGCYVLEAGDYVISINSDSHNIIDSQTYTVSSKTVYDGGNARSSDLTPAVNQFESAEGTVTYLSRKDSFANYEQATAAPSTMTMPADQKAAFINNSNYDPTAYNNAADEMPTTGAQNGLKLADLRGVDYNDAKWDQLLDQMTISEMDNLIALGGFQTQVVSSISKVGTVDCDGPASINNNFTGKGSVGFPSAVMIASTWNQELAKEFGRSIGKMADQMGVSGWYAPAMNTHRSAFAGRNFEYYSEDALLSGKIAANAVQGAKEYGVYAYIKHYALNDQEAYRNEMLCTWANEQSIREIYLKPFELAVKEGGAGAVMSSFNYIGTQWAGGTNALCNVVLRDEWGFRGMVLTDYFGVYSYMNSDQAIRNGTDFCLVNYDTETNHVKDSSSATGVLAMRQASKNILYTVVNSRAYAPENLNTGMAGWQIAAIVIDVIIAAVLIFIEGKVVKTYRKKSA